MSGDDMETDMSIANLAIPPHDVVLLRNEPSDNAPLLTVQQPEQDVPDGHPARITTRRVSPIVQE